MIESDKIDDCGRSVLDSEGAIELPAPRSFGILGVPIAGITMAAAIEQVTSWLESISHPRLVTFTNVHMLMEAHSNAHFFMRLLQMDMNCPDGMPLVWLGKLSRCRVSRVSGPDFMITFCASTANTRFRHFFYGGGPGVAEGVIAALTKDNPDLQVAGSYTPPFRDITPEEDALIVKLINETDADIIWVGLGCPKQELWMSEHRSRLNARVILSVGMAFDVISGRLKRAPELMRSIGLEWLYRLVREPKRLARRYLVTNTVFVFLLIRHALHKGEL